MENRKDLLLCENKYFLEKHKLENRLNFNKKEDETSKSGNSLKTEKVSSTILSQVKTFMDLIQKTDTKAVNIEDDDDDNDNDNDNGNDNDNVENVKHEITSQNDTNDDDNSEDDDEIIGSNAKRQKVQLDVLFFERGGESDEESTDLDDHSDSNDSSDSGDSGDDQQETTT